MARLKPGTPWTGWDDAREPLVSFEFTRGWTLECPDDPTADFSRASDRATEGRYAGRLQARTTNTIARAILRPPAPVPIPEPFDSVEIRLSIGGEAALEDGKRPAVRVVLEDPTGALRRVELGRFPHRGWHLAHRRLPVEAPLDGVRLLGLEILEWEHPATQPLYLAGLTFYTESRAPIVSSWRAEPLDLSPMAARAAGAETRAPPLAPPAPGARMTFDADAGIAEFSVPGNEGRIVYRLRLGPGLGPVEALYNDESLGIFAPPVWTPEGEPLPDRIVTARRAEEGALAIEFESGRRARVALSGRALVAELASDRRNIAFVESSAWFSPARAQGLIEIALLNAGGWIGPAVRWVRPRTAPRGLAICAYLDPRHSRASRWEMSVGREGDVRTAAIYDDSALDGRSAIRERLVWAVGERVEDVLPTIPERERGGDWPALPTAPLEAALDEDEVHPLDAAWSRSLLRRDLTGQWIAGATEGAYRVKWPLLAWLRHPAVAERLTEYRGLPVALIARLPALPPWAGVDFDPRTPGAGQFAAARRELAASYRSAARAFGAPVIGSADWIWFWADALDFWRVGSERSEALLARPLRPEFALCRLRPAGEGLLLPPAADTDAAWDRWVAALLWYGMQPDWRTGTPTAPRAERALRTVSEIARRTRGRAPVRIAYHDGRALVGGVAAAVTGADTALARLYLRYEPDLELWIRRGEPGDWTVAVGREDWSAPKDGWIARGEGFLAFSGNAAGGRVDYLEQGDEIYFDPRGAWRSLREVAADGPAVFRRERSADGWRWVAEARGALGAFAVRRPRPGPPAEARAEGFGADGLALGAAAVRQDGEWLRVEWPTGARRVRLEWRAGEENEDGR